MKTNDLKKGILIGLCFVLIPLALLSTSQALNSDETGRYQLNTELVALSGVGGGNWIYETVFDTKTGKVISRSRLTPKAWK